MPPVGVPRPDQSALDSLVTHLETTLDKAALSSPALRGPTMHRLNRAEYGNAIRDLFALQIDVSAMLPPDEEAFGFDNNASVLNVSTSLMDRYLSAAWKISAPGRRQSRDHAGARNLPRARRSVAARSRGRTSRRHARRHPHSPLLPC